MTLILKYSGIIDDKASSRYVTIVYRRSCGNGFYIITLNCIGK